MRGGEQGVIKVFKCQNKPLKYPSNNIYKYQKKSPEKGFQMASWGGLFEGGVIKSKQIKASFSLFLGKYDIEKMINTL